MLEIEPRKRLTLAVSLVNVQSARVLDDLAEMLVKRMSAIHQRGKDALADYHVRNRQRADGLVQTLRDLVTAYRAEGTAQDKIAAMEALLPNRGEAILQGCEDHMAHFRLLRTITVRATTQDMTFEEALRFLLEHEHKTGA